jgi:Adenylyl/Guanylyl and SMODS C-terminal sensor domain/Second Messenger Oligonucleotide or Dinucleotide Synthetase domain
MSLTVPISIDDLLAKIGEFLDIPNHLYEEAVMLYEDIGEHLASSDSPLHDYDPEIFPQGSFRLGTVVRPLLHEDEYDIDLVCQLAIKKESTTQAELKKKVGDRLKSRSDINKRLEEFRRCWRLDYPNQFHMDVLPVIPDTEQKPSGILLTDKELFHWQKSDPIAYAEWFYDKMRKVLEEKRAAFAAETRASIEEVPEWLIKTPLQRAVQLLKRHRDVFFQDDFDDRPTSIIITTLSGHSYEGQADIGEAILDILDQMPNYIEKRNGKWWIENPVHTGENFADKWNEVAERQENFAKWLAQARRDFSEAIKSKAPAFAATRLAPALGSMTMEYATITLGLTQRSSFALAKVSEPQVPTLSNASHCERLRWPEQLSHRAAIRGGLYSRLYGKKQLWPLTSRSVPKHRGLRFSLETNVPTPYEVWWQVVNTGREAQSDNGLRGGFVTATETNNKIHWESTLYTGTHWIEAFIIKSGVCVARSGRTYVKIR